jgi:nucleoside 2-deoxyribosyltransferase
MREDRLTKCAVCERNLEKEAEHDLEHGVYAYTCVCCGRFKCTEESDDVLPRLSTADRVRLSGVMREHSSRGEFPLIRRDNIESYLTGAPSQFDVATKMRKLLLAVANQTTQPGEWINFADDTSHPLAYAAGFGEWLYLADYGENQGWLNKDRKDRGGQIQLRLTPAGWEEVQRRPRIESAQGFVAMWFNDSMNDAYTNGMRAAIESDSGYRSRRVDTGEYNGDVVDEIMAQIRESRFVVCDLTRHRNGVYFEAGFSIGLDIPTIWTCRRDDAGQTHFDAEHFNQIWWDSPGELRKKLATRILATIGRGPLASAS